MPFIKSSFGIVISGDRYDDHRITQALSIACPICEVSASVSCKPVKGEEIYDLQAEFIHHKRESEMLLIQTLQGKN